MEANRERSEERGVSLWGLFSVGSALVWAAAERGLITVDGSLVGPAILLAVGVLLLVDRC